MTWRTSRPHLDNDGEMGFHDDALPGEFLNAIEYEFGELGLQPQGVLIVRAGNGVINFESNGEIVWQAIKDEQQ